jgi:hypothetical protein
MTREDNLKKLLPLTAVLLSLTACTTDPNLPEPGYPYNPNANPVEQNDARVPYRGDWAFVALLADGTQRSGVASVLTRFSGAGLVNAGGGVAAWCLKPGCTTSDEQGTILFGTTGAGAAAKLSIGMVPKNQTYTRFVMSDTDGVVSVTDGKPTISGPGTWRDAAGVEQPATFGFVQIRSKSDLATQTATITPEHAAERAAHAETQRDIDAGLDATFTQAVNK